MALNLGATDFVPSWMKKKAPAAEAPTTSTAPVATAPAPAKFSYASAVTSAPPAKQAAAPSQAPAASSSNSKAAAATAPAKESVSASTTPKVAATVTSTSTNATSPAISSKMNAEASSFIPKTPVITGGQSRSVIDSKSESELMSILKNSTLKFNAASFVPAHPSRKFREALALTPLALTPVVDDPDLLLADTWCLYFLPTPVANENEFDPALVFRIDSVAAFWKTINNLPPPNEIPARSAMYLFRDDIIPKWEDEKNRDGGLYRLVVPTTKANEVWLRTAAKAIGESWRKAHRNSVNGCVLKMRERAMYIEVWVSQEMPGFIKDWFDELSMHMPSAAIDFYSHKQLQEIHRDANAKKVAAASDKKKNKRK